MLFTKPILYMWSFFNAENSLSVLIFFKRSLKFETIWYLQKAAMQEYW